MTKIVLPKNLQNFEKTPSCTCWPKELNQKGLPRNLQLRTRSNGHFRFFSALRLNFKNIFFPAKGSLLQFFWSFATGWMLKNPKKGPPFQFFWHCGTFFSNFCSVKGSKFTNTLTVPACLSVKLTFQNKFFNTWVGYIHIPCNVFRNTYYPPSSFLDSETLL